MLDRNKVFAALDPSECAFVVDMWRPADSLIADPAFLAFVLMESGEVLAVHRGFTTGLPALPAPLRGASRALATAPVWIHGLRSLPVLCEIDEPARNALDWLAESEPAAAAPVATAAPLVILELCEAHAADRRRSSSLLKLLELLRPRPCRCRSSLIVDGRVVESRT